MSTEIAERLARELSVIEKASADAQRRGDSAAVKRLQEDRNFAITAAASKS